MGHIFITFSDDGRALAERAQNALEANGITTWLRDRRFNQDNFAEQQFLDNARYTATAFLVVWQAVSDTSVVPPRQLLQDIKEARDRGQPILYLRGEAQLPDLVTQVSQVIQPNHNAAPLPIPLIEEDADTISDVVAQMRSPSRRIIVSLMVGGIGSIILMGLILIVQLPGGVLNPSIITATHTLTAISTSTNIHTATATAAKTSTRTATTTSTSINTDTATATRTSTPTPTLTITYTPMATSAATLRPSATRADIQSTATQRLQPAVLSPTVLTRSVVLPRSTDSTNMLMFTNTPRPKVSAQG